MDKFFELYVSAFLSLNPASVSDFYSFPVTFYTDTGEIVSLDQEEFLANTKKLFRVYIQLDVSSIDYEINNRKKLNDYFELISVSWVFFDAVGVEIYNSITRYLVHSETMKITAVTVVDEMKKIRQLNNG